MALGVSVSMSHVFVAVAAIVIVVATSAVTVGGAMTHVCVAGGCHVTGAVVILGATILAVGVRAVSYTHLTLPTIYSV